MKGIITPIIAIVLFVALSIMISYYWIIFNKKKYNYKYVNKKILILIYSILGISIIPIVLSLLSNLFKWNNSIFIIMSVFSFAILLSVCIVLFFFLQYIIIGINEENIEFMGEKIPMHKIFNLKTSSSKNKYYIEYYEGRRGKKKYSFKLNSLAFNFIKEHENFIKDKFLKDELIQNQKQEEINVEK